MEEGGKQPLKDLLALTPEEREARKVLALEQIAVYLAAMLPEVQGISETLQTISANMPDANE